MLPYCCEQPHPWQIKWFTELVLQSVCLLNGIKPCKVKLFFFGTKASFVQFRYYSYPVNFSNHINTRSTLHLLLIHSLTVTKQFHFHFPSFLKMWAFLVCVVFTILSFASNPVNGTGKKLGLQICVKFVTHLHMWAKIVYYSQNIKVAKIAYAYLGYKIRRTWFLHMSEGCTRGQQRCTRHKEIVWFNIKKIYLCSWSRRVRTCPMCARLSMWISTSSMFQPTMQFTCDLSTNS